MISGIIAVLFGAILMFLLYTMYVIVASFIMWMAIDAGKKDNFLWLVFILGIPVVGAIAYYFVEKKRDYIKIPKQEKKEEKE